MTRTLIHVTTGAAILLLLACGGEETAERENPGASAAPQLEAAWLGTGQFAASMGDAAVKAQLEILTGGDYRFLILEPKALMLAGIEEGTWTREEQTLHLQPLTDEKEKSGILRGAPRDFRPKTLAIAEDLSELVLQDDKMNMTFKLNEKASAKLRAEGEIP